MTFVINHHRQLFHRTVIPIIYSPFQTYRVISSSTIKMGISNYASTDGEFRRKDSSFRNHIQVGGKYPPEKDRYHLYVSWACPWGSIPFWRLLISEASRVLIVRELKGLQNIISKTVVHYHMGEKGWRFVQSDDELEGSTPDTLYHAKFLREIYFRSQPDYEGRFTVPVLWDKKTETIVNNESR
jgi:glutathionyl-hydroquinone reductase